jgi:hypothetical protein
LEFVYEPWETITFRSFAKYETADQYVNALAAGTPEGAAAHGTLNWASGVLFRYFPFAPSDAVGQAYLNRRLAWDHIEFAPLPKFVKEIKSPERPLVVFTIMDVSNNELLRQFAEWLQKENFTKSK